MNSGPSNRPPLPSDSSRPNSVNMRSAALDALLNKLDGPESTINPATIKRNFVRWPFRKEAIRLVIAHPGGNQVSLQVACRNLSRGGVSLLHNAYIHPKSECIVTLPYPDGTTVEVLGRIARCIHRGGVIHEVGVNFIHPIDARAFVTTDPFSNPFSLEKVDTSALSGSVVVIEHEAVDRHIIKHFLRETPLRPEVVSTLAEGLAVCDHADVILLSAALPDTPVKEAVLALRDAGYTNALVLLAPDSSPSSRMRLGGLPVQAIVTKPLSPDVLIRALGELLLLGNTTPGNSAKPSERTSEWVRKQFTNLSQEAYRAAYVRDIPALRRATGRIGELARSTNNGQILSLVEKALNSIAGGGRIEDYFSDIETMLAACERESGSAERKAG